MSTARLVGEFTVRVATEERCTDFGQQLLSNQLQARLQGVGDLERDNVPCLIRLPGYKTRTYFEVVSLAYLDAPFGGD